jgi:hypothetical protein
LTKKWHLSAIGPMQAVIYAAVNVSVGITSFHDKIALSQCAGIPLALVGAVLMDL